MKPKLLSLLLALTLLIPFSPAFAADTPIQNSDFEQETFSWKLADTASIASGGYESANALIQTGSGDTSQELSSVPDGYYNLTAYTMYSGGGKSCYLYANGISAVSTTIPVSKKDWTLVTVRGIQVSGGRIEVGVHTRMPDDSFVKLDKVTLTPTGQPYTFLKGGDITELTYVEQCGGKFYDTDGIEKDALQILAEQGMNTARIRIYNNPGKGRGEGGYYLPEYYQSADDALNLARRAKAKGMQIQLTFHYSDYWTNGSRQIIPSDWQAQLEGLSDADAVDKLEQLVYDYTLDIMTKMKAQGTCPEYVSLGNEIQGGILYPYGRNKNWDTLARFLNAGSSAVKKVSPDSKIILHLDDAGNTDRYNNFFGNCETYGVQYDIIGPSYYPFWTKRTVAEVVDFCNTMADTFDKDILIMETGFNFSPTKPDGYPGQLSDNGPYEDIYPSSPEGQRDFLCELYSGLKNVKDGRCIGDLYWDPVMISCDGVGWAIKEEKDTADTNVVSNTTLFDFDGNALPALDAMRDNKNATTDRIVAGRVFDKSSTPVPYFTLALTSKSRPSVTRPIQCDAYGDYFASAPALSNTQIGLFTPTFEPGITLKYISSRGAGEVISGTDCYIKRNGQQIGNSLFATAYQRKNGGVWVDIQNTTNRDGNVTLFCMSYNASNELMEVSARSTSLKCAEHFTFSKPFSSGERGVCYLWDGDNLTLLEQVPSDSF